LPVAEQARQIADKIRKNSFNVVCELTNQYFYLTEAWEAAYDSGGRVYSLAGLNNEDAFVRCVRDADHGKMSALGTSLKNALWASRRVEITSPGGTNIRMKCGFSGLRRNVARFLKQRNGYLGSPSGYQGGFFAGQLDFLGIPATIEGMAVIDAYLWPPPEIGELAEPVVLQIEQGKITDISGCSTNSKLLNRWLDGEHVEVEHFCIGFNPGAGFNGGIAEAERAYGCITVGFGVGFKHVDGVMRNASMRVDGKLLQDSGSFVGPELVHLEQQLLGQVQRA